MVKCTLAFSLDRDYGHSMKLRVASLSLVLLAGLFVGCAPTVAEKKVIQITYTGTLSDGTVFDTRDEKSPLEFTIGAGKINPIIEKALIGMRVGEKKKIEVKAADAYGEYDKDAVQEVPKSLLPADLKPEAGMRLTAQSPSGPLVVRIIEVKDKSVLVDFNHPLAGKDLSFEVTVVKVRNATAEEFARSQTPAGQPLEKK
jgi:FKBP-type peptidyl-prolyl cis-trans isomerase 2